MKRPDLSLANHRHEERCVDDGQKLEEVEVHVLLPSAPHFDGALRVVNCRKRGY